MSTRITNKKIAKNLVVSMAAQLVSIITSFVLGFIVPKYIDEFQYSYWQTFLLYVGYVQIFRFGILDGLMLRYSQYDYDELDKPRVRSQLYLLTGVNSFITIVSCIVASFLTDGVTEEIIILVMIGVITKNIFTYASQSLQMINRIDKYAVIVVAQRAAYAIFIVVLIICKVNDFYWYCIADLFGDVVGILIAVIFNKGLYFGSGLPIKECLKEAWLNVSSGILIMLATLAANFIIGSGRMIIQWRWDELVFGQVSFSFSVTNVFLTFVTAISIVLFPSLKRMDEKDLPDVYIKVRNAITLLLFFVMILYFPGCWILELWLPNYADSLVYLGILLPTIIFSSKVGLLTNNYLKAYRKEKILLIINVLCVIVGAAAFAIGAYIFNSLDLVLYLIVAAIMLRSIVSEIVVTKLIKKSITIDFIIELVMTIIFILAVRFLSHWWACLAYACALVVYSIIYRKSILALFNTFLNLFKKKNRAVEPDANQICIGDNSSNDSDNQQS